MTKTCSDFVKQYSRIKTFRQGFLILFGLKQDHLVQKCISKLKYEFKQQQKKNDIAIW